jgi:integrase
VVDVSVLSGQARVSRMKILLTKDQVENLLAACKSPGAKLAVALAAFSGLGPGQVKKLDFQNLVEFSLVKEQFLEVPSRIQMLGNRRTTVLRYYTFLSSRACAWLSEDLKSRPRQRVESSVVNGCGLKEAEKAVHAASLRWHDLRDFFHQSCVVGGMSNVETDFILGHTLGRSGRFMNVFAPKAIDLLRHAYVEVEKRCFA